MRGAYNVVMIIARLLSKIVAELYCNLRQALFPNDQLKEVKTSMHKYTQAGQLLKFHFILKSTFKK